MNEQVAPKRKKVLIQTDFVLSKSGFGKAAKVMFDYLYRTNKYDLVNFAVGIPEGVPDLARTPWKSIGCVNPQQVEAVKRNNKQEVWGEVDRMAGYGALSLDNAVKQEKPDVFIGIQDIWGIDFSINKPWFKKITSALWTTLDSLPILPKATEAAPKSKNFWSWAHFATKALHKMGHTHVKTIRGPIDTKSFFRLPQMERMKLREKFKLPQDVFVIGFVFRNQLRKSVPNLLQGFKLFQERNPKAKTKLLLHTFWGEGWNIHRLAEEAGVKKDDILTTYICRTCGAYEVKPFTGHDIKCPFCSAEKSQITTSVGAGISESQLNEVYNLMDVYCHPFTSGGQEIPIQEAKLVELITLVTNYSCGEDSCMPEAASRELEWSEYREPGTEFIKATTYPSSIAKQLSFVYSMDPKAREAQGKKGRKWVIDNFSIEVIGAFLEKFIDEAPFATEDCFDDKFQKRNPNHNVPSIADDTEWLIHIYKNILMMDVDKNDGGLKYWMAEKAKGVSRAQIEQAFRNVAFSENQQQQNTVPFESLLNPADKGRVLFVMPESAGDVLQCSSLFQSIRSRYPDWGFYVATKREYRDIIEGNPYVDRWIEYLPVMDNLIWLEGSSTFNGFFNVAYLPHLQTQRPIFFHNHNGQDSLEFDIKS